MPHKFKIYPNRKKSDYYLAFIFDTKEEMLLFHKITYQSFKWKYHRKFEAICTYWRTIYPVKKRKMIGHVLFYKGYIGAGVVSHEFSHAAFFYLTCKLNKPHNKKTDEQFCTYQGEMVRQFWNKYYTYVAKTAGNC